MAKDFVKRKPISSWLKKNKGISLSFVAEQSEEKIGIRLTETAIYNFSKGAVRNPDVEKLFLSFDVPQEVIDETFKIEDD